MQSYKEEFEVTSKMVKALMKYAEKKFNLVGSQKDFSENQKTLTKYLKAEIARQLWVEEGYFFIINDFDNEVQSILNPVKDK